MVDEDETLFGVWWGSVEADVIELNNAPDFSSDDEGSTITDLLEAGVLVMIVDVVVILDDVTEDGVDWSIYRKIQKILKQF